MLIKWFGHSSFQLKAGKKNIYINPYKGEPEDYKDIADIILVSRWHFSDCRLALIKKIRNENTIILATNDTIAETSGTLIVPGQKWDFEDVKVTPVDAYTIDLPQSHPKGSGYGFLIEAEGKKLYYADDTSFTPEMTKIKADIIILPVGGTFVMNARQAARAAEIISPKLAIPSHYGSLMGSLDDAEWFKELVEAKNIKVIILEPLKEVLL